MYIILRELSKIGTICFSKPELSSLDTSEFGLEIELYLATEKNQLNILKTLEEILEIENKVITELSKDKFLKLYKEAISSSLLEESISKGQTLHEKEISIDSSRSIKNIKVKESFISDQAGNMLKLEDDQRDALQEIGNIGTGNSANALARMINKRVDINIPSVEITKRKTLISSLSKTENKIFISWCEMTGKNKGFIILTSQISDIMALASVMIDGSIALAKKINLENINFISDFSDLFQSAFSELVSILFNHYSMAVSNLLGADFINDTPHTVISEGDQIALVFEESMKLEDESVLVITTDIAVRDLRINAKMIFIPLAKAINSLLETLSEFI